MFLKRLGPGDGDLELLEMRSRRLDHCKCCIVGLVLQSGNDCIVCVAICALAASRRLCVASSGDRSDVYMSEDTVAVVAFRPDWDPSDGVCFSSSVFFG